MRQIGRHYVSCSSMGCDDGGGGFHGPAGSGGWILPFCTAGSGGELSPSCETGSVGGFSPPGDRFKRFRSAESTQDRKLANSVLPIASGSAEKARARSLHGWADTSVGNSANTRNKILFFTTDSRGHLSCHSKFSTQNLQTTSFWRPLLNLVIQTYQSSLR